jgi:CubicO group peptidase (beta-lactamase class C family)
VRRKAIANLAVFSFWCFGGSGVDAAVSVQPTHTELVDAAPSAWDTAVEQRVGSLLREAVASGRSSASVLIFVRNGEARITEGFGFEDPNGRTAVTTADSRFILNSISKTFVAVALAQLKSSGRIQSYDDAANRYLRTYRLPNSDGREITLKQLATHTAGIDEAVFAMEAARPVYGVPRAADYLAHQPRYFLPPGVLPVYSELGIDLLGLAIADVAGEPYAQYVDAEILKPFGMTKTSVGYPVEGISHLVVAFQPGAPQNVEPILYRTPMTLPDGGVVSTGEDMGRFMVALTRGNFDDLFRVQQPIGASSIAYGIVFELTRIRGRTIAYHRGGSNGTDCLLALVPAERAGVFECETSAKPLRGTAASLQPLAHDVFDLAVFDSLAPAASAVLPAPGAKPPSWNPSSSVYPGDYVLTSRHHFGIGRLRSLLHPLVVRVRRGKNGLQVDDVDGLQELSPGNFGAPGAVETFTFLKNPVGDGMLLIRSLDATALERPRLRDDPRIMDSLLAALVCIASTGLIAPFWPRLGADRPARAAAVTFASCMLGGAFVLYGFHAFGSRYMVGVEWPLAFMRACGFLTIPVACVLMLYALTLRPSAGPAATIARLHLALLAVTAVVGVGILVSVGVIGLVTQ